MKYEIKKETLWLYPENEQDIFNLGSIAREYPHSEQWNFSAAEETRDLTSVSMDARYIGLALLETCQTWGTRLE